MRWILPILPVTLLPTVVEAAPWGCDLETSLSSLPWVYLAEVLSVDTEGVDFVVHETFRGDHQPGDTVRTDYWEMGSCTSELVRPGEDYLLISEETGALQVVGYPADGYWLLTGTFDFNAFWCHPGVLSREELLLLCDGDTLPSRRVTMDVRFAGSSEFLEVTFREMNRGWESRSAFPALDGLEMERWELALGGTDMCWYEPQVTVILRTAEGLWPELKGRVVHGSGSEYHCVVYPAVPVILSPEELEAFLMEDSLPPAPILDLEIRGATPAELGLSDDPYMTTDERGQLQLTGTDVMLEITSLYSEDHGIRPAVGFDVPMTCRDPLYFRFEGLPDGPTGHLATDILDVLAKGVVEGSLSPDGDPDAPRFSLTLRRSDPGY